MEVIEVSDTWTIINTTDCASGETIYTVRNNQIGLNILYIKRLEKNIYDFSLNIKTPVYSNKGTSHIVEHCIGEDILSNPSAWNYIESSACRYNFYTLLDRTVYECGCRDRVAFDFLLEWTLKCVYRPSVYSQSDIFYTETYRDYMQNDRIKRKIGIVPNEMKKALEEPYSLLNRVIPYSIGISGFISGGTPKGIGKLTYDETLNYHKIYYRFCNSHLVIALNEDLDMYLKRLEGILSQFKKCKEEIGTKFTTETVGLGINEKCFVNEGVNIVEVSSPNLSNRYMFSVNYRIDKPTTIQKYLFYNYIRNMVYRSELKEYMGSGKMIMNLGIRTPYIGFAIALCKTEEIYCFYNRLLKFLNHKIKINNNFMMNSCSIKVWIRWITEIFVYDMDIIQFVTSMNSKNICWKEFMIEDRMKGIVIIKPEDNLKIKQREKYNKEIILRSNSKRMKNRTIFVAKPMENKENQNIIRQAEKIWTEKGIVKNYKNKVVYIYSNDKHDGFTYLYLYYDISCLINKNSDLSNVQWIIKTIIKKAYETKEYNYIKKFEGLVNMHVIGCEDNFNPDDVKVKLLIVGKILQGEEKRLLNFINNLFSYKNDIGNEITDEWKKFRKTFEKQIYLSPDILLHRRFKAMCSKVGIIEEATLGIFMYENIFQISKGKYTEDIQIIADSLRKIFSFPAYLTVYSDSKLENEITLFIDQSDCHEESFVYPHALKLLNKSEGFIMPMTNQHIAKGGNYKRLENWNTGLTVLFSYFINVEYFWKRIRHELGAYHSFMRHYSDGTLLFESMNDPGISATLDRFRELPSFLKSLLVSEQDIDNLKKDAVQRYLEDFVINNSNDNNTIKRMKNVTWEYIEDQIISIMRASTKEFNYFIGFIEDVLNQDCLCVFGDEEMIRTKCELFSMIKKLPI